MIKLTSKNFTSEVDKFEGVILVDFWATLCAPCRLQKPILEDIAKEYKGKGLKIGLVNVEDNQELTNRFNISSIPTIIIFKNGKPKRQMSGVSVKRKLIEELNEII